MARMQGAERREQLLEVARQVFAEEGFHDATALEIARRAEVSEALILKHFGTKEGLYRAAVVEPLLELLDRQREENLERLRANVRTTPAQDYDMVREFLVSWAAAIRADRGLVLSLLADLRSFPDVATELGERLKRHIDDVADTARFGTDPTAYRTYDVRIVTYVTLAGITLGALVEDDVDTFIDELVNMLFFGSMDGRARSRLLKRT